MRPSQIESWALRVIERVNAHHPIEDTLVELKSSWPSDHPKTARQIAAHANAARGEPILWLIGVDEHKGVVGADLNELSAWYPAIQARFDDLAPALTSLNVPTAGKTVVALQFDTDRAPFVVKNPAGGQVSLEVPWRDSNSTRSAGRSELLRLLVPLQELPIWEVLSGKLTVAPVPDDPNQEGTWRLTLRLYVTPRRQQRVVLPFHRCEASFSIPPRFPRTIFRAVELGPPYLPPPAYRDLSLTIQSTPHEALVDGPGVLNLSAQVQSPIPSSISSREDLELQLKFSPAGSDLVSSVSTTLRYTSLTDLEPDELGHGGYDRGLIAKWTI